MNEIKKSRTKFEKKRTQTDVIFRFIKNTRCAIHHELNSESKSASTLDILGIEIESFRKRIEYQMTPEINWRNIEMDHVKPISSFYKSNIEELQKVFNWKNTKPLLKEILSRKGTKNIFLDYQLPFPKAYQFIKFNEEGLDENLH